MLSRTLPCNPCLPTLSLFRKEAATVTDEEQELHELRRSRIRQAKRWLRLLPRRGRIHRYPILKWFTVAIRKRAFLWSFRVEDAVPAIVIGCVIGFMPLMGFQTLLAVGTAFLFRCNLPILIALQFAVVNPWTVAPIYLVDFQIGKFIFETFGLTIQNAPEATTMTDAIEAWEGVDDEPPEVRSFNKMFYRFNAALVGGAVLGALVGMVAGNAYRLAAYISNASFQRLKQRLEAVRQHREAADEAPIQEPTPNPDLPSGR
ncbi:MAG: DUF2062 domain-containing protein [Opitutales bacterium]